MCVLIFVFLIFDIFLYYSCITSRAIEPIYYKVDNAKNEYTDCKEFDTLQQRKSNDDAKIKRDYCDLNLAVDNKTTMRVTLSVVFILFAVTFVYCLLTRQANELTGIVSKWVVPGLYGIILAVIIAAIAI
ncbi:MAG: hypothetical protein Faunusvirus5_24 [Faunusvirus sp.]|uniref:Uncharacterized protein n=1 Tax=Faunusvirus sp. TaxID=2487766 RepID=A0A3G4ZWF3_9VIRU|nr:MAG: hypothetical protein Faunusvirus5_24 [Faunusvirus sp.]